MSFYNSAFFAFSKSLSPKTKKFESGVLCQDLFRLHQRIATRQASNFLLLLWLVGALGPLQKKHEFKHPTVRPQTQVLTNFRMEKQQQNRPYFIGSDVRRTFIRNDLGCAIYCIYHVGPRHPDATDLTRDNSPRES